MIDPNRIIQFLAENDVKITVRDYGKKHDARPQLMLSVGESRIPLSAEITQPLLESIVSLMTAKGVQATYRR